MTTIQSDMDVVSSLRLAIACAIGDDRFDLWFGRTEIVVDMDTVIIKAPCEFTIQWIRKNFRDALQSACERTLKSTPSLKFEVRHDVPPVASETPTDSKSKSASQADTASQAENNSPTNLSRPSTQAVQPQRRFLSLDSYVADRSNQMALTSARTVTTALGRFNPLFVHGPHGTGKTHLLEGIWSAVRAQRGRRCVFLTSEQFLNFFLRALHGGGLPNFRRRYRDVDLLIIEDLQFFIGKKATINELVFTMDAVMRDGHQLVFSANRPLNQLSLLGSDLLHRLSGGLVVPLASPGIEDRKTILRKLCRTRNLQLEDQVLNLVADRIPHDVRRLQGALNRLEMYQLAHTEPISVPQAEQYLHDLFQFQLGTVHLRDIEQAICSTFEVEPATLKSPDRSRNLANLRMLAMWLARKHTRAALSEIGDFFGRSHSTVVSAEKRVKTWLKAESTIRISNGDYSIPDTIRDLENKIRVG